MQNLVFIIIPRQREINHPPQPLASKIYFLQAEMGQEGTVKTVLCSLF